MKMKSLPAVFDETKYEILTLLYIKKFNFSHSNFRVSNF